MIKPWTPPGFFYARNIERSGTSPGAGGLSMKKRFYGVLPLLAVLAGVPAFARGASGPGSPGEAKPTASGERSIVVFVPGFMAGSPIYAMLAEGVERAAAEYRGRNPGGPGLKVTVIEGGTNQAEWEPKITALAAGGAYDLIVSSNPSLPAIVAEVSARFPRQRFLLLDGELAGNPAVYSLRYDQREQAYLAGHLAALAARDLSAAGGPGAGKIGLVAGQEYPAMTGIILPAYREGALAADPSARVDFRVVGNWYDAARGAELAADMIRNGAGVILSIAGGANEGVLQAAAEAGAKMVWFDINGYAIRPGVVVGSAILRQDRAAYEKTLLYLEGTLPFGSAELVGAAGGYVDFVEDDPLYIEHVSPETRRKQSQLREKIRSGGLGPAN
jgi:simple sugar transport system substrate-binding protein